MPKEALAELLLFLAEKEEFESVRGELADGVTMEEVRGSLSELATALQKEAAEEENTAYNPQKDIRLSKETKTLITYLSPGEEKSLLGAFGVVEKPKSVIK